MTRRALPLLIDALPAYATEAQIVGALAVEPRAQADVRALFRMAHFPRPSRIVGSGLYFVPIVVDYLERLEAGRADNREVGGVSWAETSRRRA